MTDGAGSRCCKVVCGMVCCSEELAGGVRRKGPNPWVEGGGGTLAVESAGRTNDEHAWSGPTSWADGATEVGSGRGKTTTGKAD